MHALTSRSQLIVEFAYPFCPLTLLLASIAACGWPKPEECRRQSQCLVSFASATSIAVSQCLSGRENCDRAADKLSGICACLSAHELIEMLMGANKLGALATVSPRLPQKWDSAIRSDSAAMNVLNLCAAAPKQLMRSYFSDQVPKSNVGLFSFASFSMRE